MSLLCTWPPSSSSNSSFAVFSYSFKTNVELMHCLSAPEDGSCSRKLLLFVDAQTQERQGSGTGARRGVSCEVFNLIQAKFSAVA